jgi:hypothetical protein
MLNGEWVLPIGPILNPLPMNGIRFRWEGEASAEPRRFAELGTCPRLRRFALPLDQRSSNRRTSLAAGWNLEMSGGALRQINFISGG